MVFWIGILVGGLFAWFALKMSFYEIWTMLFNIVISVYLAVFLRPAIAAIVPSAGDTPAGDAMTMFAVAIGSFLVLHGISYTFLTGQFSVSFPKIFDTLGTGLLGFLAGFLVWSFVSILICITPVSQNTFVREIGFGNQIEQANIQYVSWWCNSVNALVSSPNNGYTTEQAISKLLKKVEKKVRRSPPPMPELAEPNKTAEPNDTETSVPEEEQFLPTDVNVEDI